MEGEEETDKCREWKAGRETAVGVESRDGHRVPEIQSRKRDGNREVTGDRRMGEKLGGKQRERKFSC